MNILKFLLCCVHSTEPVEKTVCPPSVVEVSVTPVPVVSTPHPVPAPVSVCMQSPQEDFDDDLEHVD